MTVSAQYAREHLEELLDTADRGEPVEIIREGRPSAKIITMPAPAAVMEHRPIILGAGRGELVLPTDEKWREMDLELTRMMTEDPLTTTGEV